MQRQPHPPGSALSYLHHLLRDQFPVHVQPRASHPGRCRQHPAPGLCARTLHPTTLHPSICDPAHGSRDPAPEACTQEPAPGTLHPPPQTVHPDGAHTTWDLRPTTRGPAPASCTPTRCTTPPSPLLQAHTDREASSSPSPPLLSPQHPPASVYTPSAEPKSKKEVCHRWLKEEEISGLLCPHSTWQSHADRDVPVVTTCNISKGEDQGGHV